MGMKQTPVKVHEITNYSDQEGRYYKISYIYMGGVVRETKIFKYQRNLKRWLDTNITLISDVRAWLLEEE
jgi:hypothetical protein